MDSWFTFIRGNLYLYRSKIILESEYLRATQFGWLFLYIFGILPCKSLHMKYFFLNLLLCFAIVSQAQNIREKSVDLKDGSKLTYQILNGSMNGLYAIKKDGVTLLRGNYVNDKRVGNWYFFNPDNSLYMRYNYDQHKLLFVDDKVLTVANIKVLSDEPDVKEKASIPLPIASLSQYYSLLLNAAKKVIPADLQVPGNQIKAVLVSNVDPNGAAIYSVNFSQKGESQSVLVQLDQPEFPIEWIPAMFNGKGYPSEFAIETTLSYEKNQDEIKRFYWHK